MPDWRGSEGGVRDSVKGLIGRGNSSSHGSSGGGIRNQVKGLIGRGDDNAHERSADRVSMPLSSLRDPSSFAPPPRRDPRAPPPILPGQEPAAIEEDPTPAPPKPWKVDGTGLTTANLPKPPGRRDGADGRAPAGVDSAAQRGRASPARIADTAVSPSSVKPAPSLPPRLPPRGATGSPSPTSASPTLPSRTPAAAPPQPAAGLLNQTSISRLGSSGIAVPGLGIGNKSAAAPQSPTSGGGTTFAQKQAALRTASQFHKDPTSVSLSDARSAASTANNFRERHGAQIATGLQAGNRLGQKYGLATQAQESGVTAPEATTRSTKPSLGHLAGQLGVAAGPTPVAGVAAAKKKPAPPPPKKKPELSGAGSGVGVADAPPPVPLSTRPKF